MVGAQTAQFFREIAFEVSGTAHKILGQLGGDVDLVPAVIAVQDLAQRSFVARVDVCGIEIVHTCPDGSQDFLFGFVQVDACALAGKSHTAVPQNGERPALFIVAVLHVCLRTRRRAGLLSVSLRTCGPTLLL